MLQSWVNDITEAGEVDESDLVNMVSDDPRLSGVAAVDFTNAYGKFLRSASIKGMLKRAPCLAHLALSLWGSCDTLVWQRSEGQWRAGRSVRGGFQGMRFVMYMFCFALE